MRAMSPVAVHLEDAAHRWLIALLGLPPECAAATVTGAQMANFTALAAARHALLARAGWNVERDGLFGAPPIQVVVSEQAHTTVGRALAMLGLGRGRVTSVAADEQGRIDAAALQRAVSGPAIVCLQAGNVNTGAFDGFAAVMPHLRRHDAWVHIDGAFGLWAAASPRYAHLMQGAADADSWATDGHKTLNVPYDCGLAFVRHGAALQAAMSMSGAYLASAAFTEPLWRSPDASRRARGVELWMALRSLGSAGVATLVDKFCGLAQRMAAQLTGGGLEVVNQVVFNQVLVRIHPSAIDAIQQDGVCWCGGTEWQGRPAMRISVSNWSTTEADIDRAAQAIVKYATR
ncbi:MAG: aminotransferase class V-fold PLP-dependent enzyme [Bryobacterales bacterium]|nr:aminotransferase class V-fold PLP-dependent enzyme [Bryobacterales bacterium]